MGDATFASTNEEELVKKIPPILRTCAPDHDMCDQLRDACVLDGMDPDVCEGLGDLCPDDRARTCVAAETMCASAGLSCDETGVVCDDNLAACPTPACIASGKLSAAQAILECFAFPSSLDCDDGLSVGHCLSLLTWDKCGITTCEWEQCMEDHALINECPSLMPASCKKITACDSKEDEPHAGLNGSPSQEDDRPWRGPPDCCELNGVAEGKGNTCAISDENQCVGCDYEPVLCMTHGCSTPDEEDCCLSPDGFTIPCSGAAPHDPELPLADGEASALPWSIPPTSCPMVDEISDTKLAALCKAHPFGRPEGLLSFDSCIELPDECSAIYSCPLDFETSPFGPLVDAPASPAKCLKLTEVFYRGGEDLQYVQIKNTCAKSVQLDGVEIRYTREDLDWWFGFRPLYELGTIAGNSCAVIGGPLSNAQNGFPKLDLAKAFFKPLVTPALRDAEGIGLAYQGVEIPFDVVLYGDVNIRDLPDESGSIGELDIGVVPPGRSMRRANGAWFEQAPSPGSCAVTI